MIDVGKLGEFLKGDEDAIQFNLAVHEAFELWDDLIDRDWPITPDAINRVFYALLIGLPRNAFYQQHFALLNPLIEAAILDWHAANDMEARKSCLETAYGLRCTGQAITTMCARIVGGVEWATKVNIELRGSGETFAEYIKDFGER